MKERRTFLYVVVEMFYELFLYLSKQQDNMGMKSLTLSKVIIVVKAQIFNELIEFYSGIGSS